MRFLISFSLACISVAVIPPLQAQEYLKEGKLTQTLKIVQLQGGFAGNTGKQYTVLPDGSWTSESVFNQKTTPKGKGKLAADDLKKLAGILEKYELTKLPAKSGKAPGANPHNLRIEFGDTKASLIGQTAPKVDPNATTVESRFAGIVTGVTSMLKASKDDAK